MSTTTGPAYVRELKVTTTGNAVSGLSAYVAVDVIVDGMTVRAEREVDVWEALTEGQRNQFRALVAKIATM